MKRWMLVAVLCSGCADVWGFEDGTLMEPGSIQGSGTGTGGSTGSGSGAGGSEPKGCVTHLSAGLIHTCALRSDRTLWCWGSNESKQLGIDVGTTVQSTPVQILAAGKDNLDVIAGGLSTCVRKENGSLWCWGSNIVGQLGLGTVSSYEPIPKEVTFVGKDFLYFSIAYHACIVKNDGSLWCWGENSFGQANAKDTVTPQVQPTHISMGAAVSSASVGLLSGSTCTIDAGNQLWCWGDNRYGRLGIGSASEMPVLIPTVVPELGNTAGEVNMGAAHTCARKSDGHLWCWGEGAIGDGSYGYPRKSPVLILSNSADVKLGGYHTCARSTDNAVSCWGRSEQGAIGIPTEESYVLDPSPVLPQKKATGLALGNGHSCALLTDQSVWCWGYNRDGQVGIGSNTDVISSPSPVSVPCL